MTTNMCDFFISFIDGVVKFYIYVSQDTKTIIQSLLSRKQLMKVLWKILWMTAGIEEYYIQNGMFSTGALGGLDF